MKKFAKRYRRLTAILVAVLVAISSSATIAASGFWEERFAPLFLVGVCAGLLLLTPVMVFKRLPLGPTWILLFVGSFCIATAYGPPVASGAFRFIGMLAAALGMLLAMESFVIRVDMRQTRSISRL